MENLKSGESVIYYRGKTPTAAHRSPTIAGAWKLYLDGKVTLVQKLVDRKGDIGIYEYIAVGR